MAAEERGDRQAEYAAFKESCALVARADRAAVRVGGARPVEMLNGLVTNQVSDLGEGGRHALLLSAKGRVLTDLRVFPFAETLLLDVPRKGLPNLLATLKKYLPPIYATYEDASDEMTLLGLYGPSAAVAARDAFGSSPPPAHLGVARLEFDGAPLLLIRNRRLAGDGVEVVAATPLHEGLWSGLLAAVAGRGGCAAGSRALEIVRVESGVPSYGIDISEENLAHETGLEEEAISYDKGCYLGQEVVARVHFRGHVNRRLTGLRFAELAARPGAALLANDKQVGAVTSSVRSPIYGPIGLGYVRLEVDATSELRYRDGERVGRATLAELPFRHPAV